MWQTWKCYIHTRFPWHLASHEPSQHMLVKGRLAYQTESDPARQKGQSRKEDTHEIRNDYKCQVAKFQITNNGQGLRQWFSGWLPPRITWELSKKILMPCTHPPRDSDLTVVGCGLDIGILKSSSGHSGTQLRLKNHHLSLDGNA